MALIFFLDQKIDGKALFFLSKEGSVAQLEVCGLKTVGDQMHLREFVYSLSQDPAVDIAVGRRTSKPSLKNIKQCSEMNQRIYKAKWALKPSHKNYYFSIPV